MPRSTVLTGPGAVQTLHVSAGILHDADGRILITERLGDAAFAGLWEFPGGKIVAGETAAEALHRELAEELGIEMLAYGNFMQLDHEYPDRRVSIDFFLVDAWRGRPFGKLGQQLRWLAPEDVDAALMLPADAPVLRALKGRASGRVNKY